MGLGASIQAIDPQTDPASGKRSAIEPPSTVGVFEEQTLRSEALVQEPEGGCVDLGGNVDDRGCVDPEAKITARQRRCARAARAAERAGRCGWRWPSSRVPTKSGSSRNPIACNTWRVGRRSSGDDPPQAPIRAPATRSNFQFDGRRTASMQLSVAGDQNPKKPRPSARGSRRPCSVDGMSADPARQLDSGEGRDPASRLTRLAASMARRRSEYLASGAECVSSA